ncbi:helix-turn-helix domain-containing protein [Nocardioides panaciterrulae]|uniref:Transcriptional regulator of acetoin/glycerol metabolism n=1 Tax=Nocardioides panaciterrulae TaxID=661492 RepID=A0A7Y9E8H5_9ACTN|nr:helix-turn-helix domain-containing protein [Nocardioides panaciterrulae]NYD43174.1 transcriptional regulator of acetoin/glycerol metabolism [Nocardioides panaciterrulae]
MDLGDVPERARLHPALRAELPGSDVEADGGHVSRRLLASWQRSQEYGVPLEAVAPVFTGTYDEESLFFECGRRVLTDLHRTLVNEPISLMLTDADGLVLNRLSGDHALLRALDAVHLAPGFGYAERAVGTNGLGLALADRVPTVVRAEEHYSLSLCSYTCAAVPVLDPLTGRLEGSVNLTTWSTSSSDLLLALAQSAAGNTAALMLARSQGRRPRPAPRGEVFRVETEPGGGTVQELSAAWTEAVAQAEAGLAAGRVVAAVGEPGAGRATMLAQAQRHARPRDRILSASTPAPQDTDPWLALWSPELGKPSTAVVVCDVDALPTWAAERLRQLVWQARADRPEGPGVPFTMTAERFEDIPAPLAGLVGTVVQVPPLRDRVEDVLPLAHHAARKLRGRGVDFTAAAVAALRGCAWPGNVDQLHRVVRDAATRTDVVDVRHLPAEVLSGSPRRLSRIEAFERDEIVRVLTRPGVTMREAAEELGMGRATIYRKVAAYDIHIPKH